MRQTRRSRRVGLWEASTLCHCVLAEQELALARMIEDEVRGTDLAFAATASRNARVDSERKEATTM